MATASAKQKELWDRRIYIKFRVPDAKAEMERLRGEMRAGAAKLKTFTGGDAEKSKLQQRQLYARKRLELIKVEMENLQSDLKAINGELKEFEG